MAADAGTLNAVTIRSRAAATDADSKDSASLMTEPITAPLALTEVFGDHLQSSRRWLFGESGQPTLNHNASVLRTHYSLKQNTHLLSGTWSGIARRDNHVQPTHSSLYPTPVPSLVT